MFFIHTYSLPSVSASSCPYRKPAKNLMSRQKKCGFRTFIQSHKVLVKPAFVEYKDRTRTLIVIAITACIRKRMREDSAHSPNAKIYQIFK